MNKATVAERYGFRAKYRVNANEVKWVYGALSWREVMPSPIQSKDNDCNLYKITSRQDNVCVDWNMPYPTIVYWIQKEFYDTITPYSGWKDMNGEKIYYEDVIRIFDTNDKHGDGEIKYWDCWVTEFGLLLPCSIEFETITNYCNFDSDTRRLIDCKIVGNRWDGPLPGFELQDWIIHNQNWNGGA